MVLTAFLSVVCAAGIRNSAVRKPVQSYARHVVRVDRNVLDLLDPTDVHQSVPATRWRTGGARPGPFRRLVAGHIQLGLEGVRAHIP